MKFEKDIALKNIKRKPARTAALIILTAFLALSVFGGSLIVMSLQNGLESYKARLGADVVVVPYEAQTKGKLESILLQGIPGYFYMDSSVLDKIRGMDGVEVATPQFYLASASAGCCSVPVQIIGFDPETDFSIQPWIHQNYAEALGKNDIIVGYDISIPTNYKLTFYDTECNVVSQLNRTGTGLDSCVYASMDTIKEMMKNASALGFNYFNDIDVDRAISSVMVKTKEGYSPEEVSGDINIHVRRVEATGSQNMITSIAGGLMSVSRVIGILVILIWVLALIILIIAFIMIANERTKEFAVLRTIGASKKMMSRFLKVESVIISIIGAVIGVAVACIIVFPFSNAIQSALDLPLLMPSAGQIVLLIIGSVVLSVAAGWFTSMISAHRLVKNETGLLLRDNA